MSTAGFEIDLFSPEVLANPAPHYRTLRDQHPVYYSDLYDTFFLSRFEDVWEALRIGDNALVATETNLPTPEYLRTHRNQGAPAFVSTDPMAPGPSLPSPWYEQMRLAHIAPLRPKGIEELKTFIRDLVRTRLELLLPQRKFNLTVDYAGMVAVTVICHLFGLSADLADQLLQNVNEMSRYDPAKRGIDLSTFFRELQRYIVPAVQARRAAGADGSNGLIDGLINFRIEAGQRALSDSEIADQLVCAMVGGMESVPKVTAQGILELWQRPEQLEAVRANLAANVPIAVQEMIRYCAPAQYTFRTAHRDLTIAGREVRAGQRVACMLHSASRDEREFDDPDRFVWNRPIRRVLSFGLGQHHCIGKHLAQLEVVTLVQTFLSRVRSFDFALDEATRNAGYFQRGWTSLPVRIGATQIGG